MPQTAQVKTRQPRHYTKRDDLAHDAPEAPVEPAEAPDGFLPMSEAPRDGKTIVLTENGAYGVEAVYKNTRGYDRKTMRWVARGYWAIKASGGLPVPFEPAGWKAA